ncbi:N-hydroxyarylamine O-acetyltransferase [Actinokineospora baliensis]|uniref:arylamine N-acetyltransferase family protein n=1 Tax=Actinokineospora baliensis TaxID=547056 RepID=UPI00195B1318|nr:arylamine N-acetyltransferase [Actinokineospora baliensis]MBM7774536.1 N-hydroxyarylamine O-acetyltransferase [Actinokineospora baliensis]
MSLSHAAVDAYLERIGTKRPARPTSAALRHLHERHVLTVPFENIDYILRKPVEIGADAYAKIVERRRGGGCYELNGAFAALLEALGYDVTVYGGRAVLDGVPGPLMGHLVLRVLAEDSPDPWLADVGFGRATRFPMVLDSREPQPDPMGTYQISDAGDGDLDVHRNGTHQYRFETHPRSTEDFLPMVWWFRHAEDSPFLTDLFCSRHTPTGKVTLTGTTLTRLEDGQRVKETLVGDDAVRAAYLTHFDLDLDELPVPPGGRG